MNIKKIVIIGFLFMLVAHTVTDAVSDEELYLQGNGYYLQEDYDKALTCYKEIKRKGPAVFHNMGNCHSYLANPVDALISWRLAQRGAGYKEFDELEHLITREKQNYYTHYLDKMAESRAQDNNKMQDGKKSYSKNNFFSYTQRLFSPYSLLWLQLLFLCIWYLLFLLFFKKRGWQIAPSLSGNAGRRAITREADRAMSWFTSLLYLCILGCMIFLGIILGAGIWLKNRDHNYQQAIVTQTIAPLHAGPQHKFKKIGELRFLDEILVQQSNKHVKQEKWCKVALDTNRVKTGKQKTGWVEEASIRIISESLR